ncbi:UDP-N-acetylmuramate--L-alanine ligase [Marinicella litoralis]|uniref:UDP-N-acetylmuramate--L-alanine ligase n=1 Tax=Marinicella litoralis TaxID=644220 RepID=A0A4R6XS29_9GAMM|nr:UDP-N-acetylmuramate--L-alanine ligase [Marinicella litoralis]TDR22725.1 UDP-N-acetylmuramate--L-alanine ligase [Marinicella litoralis]
MSYLNPEHKFASRMKRIHLIGVGGSGVSGIAEVLHNLDFAVSGSDMNQSKVTDRLLQMGIKVYIGHDAAQVEMADVVVYSSAIKDNNCELKAARAAQIPVLTRAEMLAELMRFKIGIAVAGTHGKTTTTSLIASVLAEAGLDPTFVIGGLLNAAGTNAGLGTSEYLVAEADESDGSFQLLQPVMAVVTNIDEDHMETFDNDIDQLKQSFATFLHRVPFYGVTVLCVDDDHVYNLSQKISRHQITYGLSERAQIRAINLTQIRQDMWFDVVINDQLVMKKVKLNLPGKHNVLNALAAIAIGLELDVDLAAMQQALGHFDGVGRRFNIYTDQKLNGKSFTLIDDYAHHPTELAAAISACRSGWTDSRLVVVFQPHRYSRTRDLFDDFAEVLSQVDLLLMSEVYPAGEEIISGATSNDLCRSVRNRGKLDPVYVNDINAVPESLGHVLENGDVVLMLGAGNIGTLIQNMTQGGQHE